ncbi:hypothetical protein [Rahnella]|jgi:hypothetical protein|uniref:Uncharacterized protein n=1 Tax=Rahnella victoriana TaxID=1510570 RepID=A0ABS0DMI3_9GAMM|nr:hypothetical protein [Rahnella]VTQ54319.1 Uncharacterised protein [Campylobacter jejuni]MBF7955101.1 hypothetical protein [Rahnella victoriana]PBI82309.1 hypothetical protein A9993_01485 [Rahnella victoriana]TBX31221.1 hypothetical protein EYY67_22795 [Rahnella victoriana]TDS96612.1 hypothetical protein EDF78_102127 [Rahnella sp. BIGb0236]
MTRNTQKSRKAFASRLTHIMQIQTQYGRLWLRSRFRRMYIPASLKIVLLASLGLLALALTGTLLLILDAVALVSGLLRRPFRRGSFRPLIRKSV